jgi:hypothetical protein
MSVINLTPSQLRHAADLKEQIEKLQHQLSQLHGEKAVSVSAPAAKRGGRKFTAAGLARIRAAQKARWAKLKTAPKAAPKPVKLRRKMSAEARAKIAAAAKARWAKVRADKAAKK